MRTTTAGEDTVLGSANYATHCRVLVEDADGTYQDLTTADGLNWVHSGRISQTVDQIVATAEVLVWRDEEGGESLSPLDEGSALNVDALAAYAPLIDVGRGVRVDVATVATAATPGAGDWQRVFDGTIDEWDTTDTPMVIRARDAIGAEIADRLIETEMELGSEAGVAIETVMQDILTAWTDSITLYTPSTPGFVIEPYRQQRMSVMDALQQLAALIGWVVESRWDDGTSAFRLTFYEPDRAASVADWTWAANRYTEVNQFRLSRLNVRNALSLWYTDANGARQQYTASDTTSIAKYKRQWMEIEEGDDSSISTAAEAQTMLDNALLDLKDPVAEQEVKVFCFWPIQLGDYYAFTANNVHYDTNQAFGVTGFRHEWDTGHVATYITTRGKPAGFVTPWIVRGGTRRDPAEGVDALRLYDVRQRVDYPTTGNVTFEWTPGADVASVWPYLYTHDIPIQAADQIQPTDGEAPTETIVDRGTDTITVAIPAAGFQSFLTLEPRASDGEAGYPFRIQINPKAMSTGADIPAGSVLAEALIKAAQTYGFDATWGASAATTATWGAGTLTFADGGSYSIGSGSATGLTSSPTYIYFDATVSTTTLQTTTDWGAAVGDTAVLLATAWAGAVLANVVPGVGVLGLDGNAIRPLSIQTNQIAANAITAAKISVASLSAIAANIGTVTAGRIQDSINANFINLNATGSQAWLSTGALDIRAGGDVYVLSGTEMYWGGVVSGSGVDAAGGVMHTGDTAGGGARGIALTDGVGGAILDVSGNRVEFSQMATEVLQIVDAGSTSATEQDWIQVTVGGNTGYIRVFASK